MDTILKTSYQACERIAKERAGNFYYAFTVLPREKRRAICAVYAFMRYCDDISDSDNPPASKLEALQQWRSTLDETVAGSFGESVVLPAFHHTLGKFNIPPKYFHELIDGAQMDLSISRYQTFDDLYQYCYRVASVVGLICIHIFGFSEDVAMKYAEYDGIAFQLTNILRDVKEDAERNRIYLPLDDLIAAGYSESDLLSGIIDERFRELMSMEVERAKSYYKMGTPLVNYIDAPSRAGLLAMVGIYSSILGRIEERDFDVFKSRVTLSTTEKLGIAARSLISSHGNSSDTVLVQK